MNTPTIPIVRCSNPACPSLKSSFRGEWVLLKEQRVMLYTNGTEVTTHVYRCAVCNMLFEFNGSTLIPITWSV